MSLINIKDLVIKFHTDDGIVSAVNNLTLEIEPGETLGIVGETGAGKTTSALGIMGLVDTPPGKIESGEIIFEGKDLLKMSEEEKRDYRGKEISMIFQDPMTALNPVLTVLEQVKEVVVNHNNMTDEEAEKIAIEMLELVRIPKERSEEYPHQFSGGMKQRVVIAIALACNPKLLIADEPTTALDVTIQAQVLEMMKELIKNRNTSLMLITHDLGVVSEICDRVAIMYAGSIVESGSLKEIFTNPKHPYTLGLFGSIPSIDDEVEFLSPIEGLMPDPCDLPKGCRFHPRCKYAEAKCSKQAPKVSMEVGTSHGVSCLMYEDELSAKGVSKIV